MKIAVIDHVGNHGGGSRVVRALLPAIRRADPSVRMDYFGNPASMARDGLADELAAVGIRSHTLASQWITSSALSGSPVLAKAGSLAQARLRQAMPRLPHRITGDVCREVESRVRGFDLAFFPWPFFLRPPRLDCPSVGIFHDLNFKYYFSGADTFPPRQRQQLESETARWLEMAVPVVSTDFMASELRHFYPAAAHEVRRIYLAPLGGNTLLDAERARGIVRGLGIDSPYLLCTTHMCSHKNIGPLIAAQALLRAQGRDLVLVITGAGTDALCGHATEIGVRLERSGGDVIGLGYVSNEQIDALVQRAAVVVNPSLYEAGNGPGMDAFGRGTPVAMSNIPAFTEHIVSQGMRAQTFDPRSPDDIAEKIARILDDPQRARDDAQHSMRALAELTWERTADEYLSLFREVVSTSHRHEQATA